MIWSTTPSTRPALRCNLTKPRSLGQPAGAGKIHCLAVRRGHRELACWISFAPEGQTADAHWSIDLGPSSRFCPPVNGRGSADRITESPISVVSLPRIIRPPEGSGGPGLYCPRRHQPKKLESTDPPPGASGLWRETRARSWPARRSSSGPTRLRATTDPPQELAMRRDSSADGRFGDSQPLQSNPIRPGSRSAPGIQ